MSADPRFMSIVPVAPTNAFKRAAAEMRNGLAQITPTTDDERRMVEAGKGAAEWLEHLGAQIPYETGSPVLIAACAQLSLDGAARHRFREVLDLVEQLT